MAPANSRLDSAKSAQSADDPRRRAYILIVVLGLTAVITTLGLAFLDSHNTVLPEAMNRAGTSRATYLAESGVGLGMHYLMYPPEGTPPWSYWTGANGIAIDATSDYTDVSIVRDATDKYKFTITATGVAHDADGSVRAKHSVTAEVLRPTDGKWHIPYAYVGGGDTYLPWTAKFYGPLHCNGLLTSLAWCKSAVSATQNILWFGTGPPSSFRTNAPTYYPPTTTASRYSTYTVNGVTYTAYTYTNSAMSSAQATTLNGLNWSLTNPGRIIVRSGNLRLDNNVALNGTLVVVGDLQLKGSNLRVTAVDNYPAVMVTGDLRFTDKDDMATFVGSVICGGVINDNGTITNLNVTGSMICMEGFSTVGALDNFQFTWDANRSVFWDFDYGAGQSELVTVLSWRDN